ncbi:MAG: Smr/MutS family protein [Thermoanaerobaculia bacterium]
MGGKRLRTVVSDLVLDDGATPKERRAAASRSAPPERGVAAETAAPAELHLIGQRVEPALAELDDYLDRALRAGRLEVRVVHGHGTGRLREAVREHLRRHRAVSSVRAGAPEEGGNGATVVALRG